MWNYPPQQLFQQAQQQNPTAGITAAQSAQAPGMPGQQYGPPPGQGLATQIAGNQRSTGQTPNTPAADPNSFGTNGYTSTSNQWYGKGNEYGADVLARSPYAFWGGYAEDQMGLQPGSNAANFLASKYNPMALGAAMYGKGFTSQDQILAGSTAIANQIAKPGTTFFNPGAIIGSVLQALQSGNAMDLMKINPTLAGLIQQSAGDPVGQISALTDFLKQVLSATMPPDTLNAFINQINQLGQVWFSQMRKNPNMNAMDSGTFAKFLTQNFGPTLGL